MVDPRRKHVFGFDDFKIVVVDLGAEFRICITTTSTVLVLRD